MLKANIIYWYGLSEMPRDGGGLRALAWHQALTDLGFESSVVALRPDNHGVANVSRLRSAKQALLPMPFASSLPPMEEADLNVVTVPSVFASAAKILPKNSLVFDWMDLWSVNAWTMGRSSWLSRPGGAIQSLLWSQRQRRLIEQPAVNVFAGYNDHLSTASDSSAPAFWVPTPIEATPISRIEPTRSTFRVGFIGNFAYRPNVTSLRSFFERYGEAFEKKGIEVVVAGYGSEVVQKWNVSASILGRIDSLQEFYAGIDASIVPIIHGGGIKAKAVESMAYGVPVFGTDHVKGGFSPEWGPFIGDIDQLLRAIPTFPPVPDPDTFRLQFSQKAFKATVDRILSNINQVKA